MMNERFFLGRQPLSRDGPRGPPEITEQSADLMLPGLAVRAVQGKLGKEFDRRIEVAPQQPATGPFDAGARNLEQELFAPRPPVQAQGQRGRNDHPHGAARGNRGISDTDMRRAAQRHLEQHEMLQLAGGDGNGGAIAQDKERQRTQLRAAQGAIDGAFAPDQVVFGEGAGRAQPDLAGIRRGENRRGIEQSLQTIAEP